MTIAYWIVSIGGSLPAIIDSELYKRPESLRGGTYLHEDDRYEGLARSIERLIPVT